MSDIDAGKETDINMLVMPSKKQTRKTQIITSNFFNTYILRATCKP